MLRDGLELAVDPRAREGFEHFCFRSPEMVEELDGFLAEMPHHRRLVDVGACHGLFSLLFVAGRDDARALAVEPSLRAREVLAANVEANRAEAVSVAEKALGAAPGRLRMRANWHHLEAVADSDTSGDTVEIRVVTLDELCRTHGFVPDLLKIDVEGYELEVLRGAAEVLRRHQPLLFLELHPTRLVELGHDPNEILDLLAHHGYRLHRVGRSAQPLRYLRASDPVQRVVGRTK